jgi:hypothetical protein
MIQSTLNNTTHYMIQSTLNDTVYVK